MLVTLQSVPPELAEIPHPLAKATLPSGWDLSIPCRGVAAFNGQGPPFSLAFQLRRGSGKTEGEQESGGGVGTQTLLLAEAVTAVGVADAV